PLCSHPSSSRTFSLHDALPISQVLRVLDPETAVARAVGARHAVVDAQEHRVRPVADRVDSDLEVGRVCGADPSPHAGFGVLKQADRKSTRLNSSHEWSSYAVFW